MGWVVGFEPLRGVLRDRIAPCVHGCCLKRVLGFSRSVSALFVKLVTRHLATLGKHRIKCCGVKEHITEVTKCTGSTHRVFKPNSKLGKHVENRKFEESYY
jgi:hypothetical protein